MLISGIRQLLAIILIAAFVASLSAAIQKNITRSASLASDQITPEEIPKISWNRLQFVDTRSLNEFQRGHPPGAVLLNSAGWDSLIAGFYDAWEPGKRIIVYGRARSDETAAVAHRLRTESGLDEVWVLKGIWEECP